MFYHDRIKLVGERIKKERKAAHLTQEELLVKVFLSKSSVASLRAWERGERLPDMDTLSRMCEVFQCDFGYLIGDYAERDYPTHKICEATGLSKKAVNILEKKQERVKQEQAAGWSNLPEAQELSAASDLISGDWNILFYIYQYLHGDYDAIEFPGKTDDNTTVTPDVHLVSKSDPRGGTIVRAEDLQAVFLLNIQNSLNVMRQNIQRGLKHG